MCDGMKQRLVKLGKQAIALLLFPLSYFLFRISADNPQMTEQYYSGWMFARVNSALVALTSILPVSLAEILVILIALYVLFRLGSMAVGVIKRENSVSGRVLRVLETIVHLSVIAGVLVFLYVSLWGLNNNRQPFAEAIGLSVEKSTVQELKDCCLFLLEQTNVQRESIPEDDAGVMRLEEERRAVMDRAGEGYEILAANIPSLGRVRPGRAKPVMMSELMSYAGITGIYFPMTAEANINVHIPDVDLPFTICHELAHQLGYASEDEANFISWLACSQSPYPEYQYSGNYSALVYLMNALAAADRQVWQEVYGMCSPELQRDLAAASQYWDQFKGPIQEVSTAVNDSFLKANRQEEGVRSYGKMADLVMAWIKAEMLNNNE